MTNPTPDAALLWADEHAPYGTARHYGVMGFRAGQSHAAGLLAALEGYARDFCETSFGGECCGKLSAVDCGGCAAYAAIAAAKGA